MDKITKVNVEGDEYGFVAGQTVKGVSGALASDYVKHIILPEGAEVVEGMLIAVTFVNDNTAGYSGEKTVYSTDGINFYWDSGYTQLITLPPQGCYTVTETETQYEYKLSEYPVLVMGDMTKPFCDSRGHPAGGKLWQAGDTVTVINLENRFIALQTTVNEIIQGSSLPVTSGAVYEKCNSLEPVDHVTSGNLHSVTSNAVAEEYKYVLNKALPLESGFSVVEYIRYSKFGRLVVVDIGGLISSIGGLSLVWCTSLPIIRTRFVSQLFLDGINTTQNATVYGDLNTTRARIHAPANVRFYGTVVYFTD